MTEEPKTDTDFYRATEKLYLRKDCARSQRRFIWHADSLFGSQRGAIQLAHNECDGHWELQMYDGTGWDADGTNAVTLTPGSARSIAAGLARWADDTERAAEGERP